MRRFGPPLFVALGLAPLAAAAAPTEPNELVNPLDVSADCQGCHAFANPGNKATDPPFAPGFWAGSLMANSARDPVFWAGVALAEQDDAPDTIECVRCHSPNAFLEGRGDAISMAELTTPDLDGVTCDVCHRQVDDGVTPPGNARYVIDDTLVDAAVPKRGPWTYTDPVVPPHSVADGSFLAASRSCGTCHDVTTPRERVDDSGTGLGLLFNEQRTYSEWANSAYGVGGGPDEKSCQDCHMPAVEDVAGCAMFLGGNEHATGGRRHELVGANRMMITILKDLYGSAGDGTVDDFWYETTIARMDEFLSSAASLDVAAPNSVDLASGLDLTVTVTNESGHKLPTGYSEGRVMWLEVTGTYGGEVVYVSGDWEPGTGPLDDPQLRTYEGVAEDFDDKVRNHLLKNNHWIEDTRIPPKGLVPDIETDPVGDRYTVGMDGAWPNQDVVDYSFGPAADVVDVTPADDTDDVLQVSVRLMYMINTDTYLETLADDNVTNSAGEDAKALFDDRGGSEPVVFADWTVDLPLTGLVPPSGTGSSGSSSSDGQTDGGSGTASTTSVTDASSGPSTDSDTDTDGDTGQTNGGGGCGCATGVPGGGWLLIPGLLTLAPRRRRRQAVNRPGTSR